MIEKKVMGEFEKKQVWYTVQYDSDEALLPLFFNMIFFFPFIIF